MTDMILRHKYKLIIVLVLAVIAYFAVPMYIEYKTPKETLKTSVVKRGNIEALVSATGTISPVNSVDVSSKITGLITKVHVEENDYVEEGTVLIELDDTSMKAQLAQVKAKLVNAEINYYRNKKLADTGAISYQSLDGALMDYEVAKAAYEDYVSQVEDTIIKAPMSGIVIGEPISAGQTVAPGISTPMILLTISDMSKMQVETKIDESDIGQIKVGQKAIFTVDTYPDRIFSGVVSRISQLADTTDNVIYYPVTIDIDAPEGLLFPTMTARVSVTTGVSKDTLLIPLLAVKESAGKKVVQVLGKNNEVQTIAVVTGLSTDESIEILQGLNEGDVVVLPQSKQTNNNFGGGMPRF
ncbi:efflux RND transporter periplasmic adaptor subunit [Selenomonadales bacterium OttesenSCG-928-I06]|nr:efflux RND transporter periplasmic adaptor subunit [Selenomonadales bacterium OttesenSCG-928-I06]